MSAYLKDGLGWHDWPGDGLPVVMLHGIGSAGYGFEAVALQSGRRALAWDMPGYGASADLETDWPDAGDYADAALRWMDLAGIDRADVLGHSLGAMIAGRLARVAPDRVRRLILSAPALGHGTARGTLSEAAQARIDGRIREGAAPFAEARAARLLAHPHGAALAAVRDQMALLRVEGYTRAARLLSCGDLLADAAQLACPTDVVLALEDRITPPDTARRLHRALPDAVRGVLYEIPDTGHAMAAEAPKALAAVLTQKEDA